MLQRLDPRVKVAGLGGLIVTAALSSRLIVIAAVFAIAIALAAFSRVSIATLASNVWIEVFAFTGVHRASCHFSYTRPCRIRNPSSELDRYRPGFDERGLLPWFCASKQRPHCLFC